MKLLNHLHNLATSLEFQGRVRNIGRDPNVLYLKRYFLSSTPGAKERHFPAVFLHHFLKSDEPVFHDHPWHWASLVLAGGYWENTPQGRFWRKPGSFRMGWATSTHWVELDPAAGEVWTLFVVSPRIRDWGFIHPVYGWLQWEIYLALEEGEDERTEG